MPKAEGTKTCVLSGPISQIVEGNIAAFEEAKASLERDGWVVWSPRHHRLSEDCYREAVDLGPAYASGKLYRQLMRECFTAILHADQVFVLPGWLKSRGAQREVLFAMTIGVPVDRLILSQRRPQQKIPSISERFRPVDLLFEDRHAASTD